VLLTNYYLGDQIEKNKWAGHVARMRKKRKAFRLWVAKPEGKIHLEDLGVVVQH
jgi:hypothetical protein